MRSSFCKPFVLITVIILFLAVLSSAYADERLRGYDADNGYIYLVYGNYPQWIDGGNPKRDAWTWGANRLEDFDASSVSPSPILWRILKAEEDHLYLCSEYVLLAHPLHIDYGEYRKMGKYFEQTDLSQYLNTVFLNDAFTQEEQSHILPHETYGPLYLLGQEDFKDPSTGLQKGEKAKAWGTEYAIRVTGLFVYLKMRGMHSCYWLRNPSTVRTCNALCIKANGAIGNLVADRKDEGVRPVLQLRTEGLTIQGGSGTLEDPYQILFQ